MPTQKSASKKRSNSPSKTLSEVEQPARPIKSNMPRSRVITWGIITLCGIIFVGGIIYVKGPLAFAGRQHWGTIIRLTETPFPHTTGNSFYLVRLDNGKTVAAQTHCGRRSCIHYEPRQQVLVLTTPYTSEAILGSPGDAFKSLFLGLVFTLPPTIISAILFWDFLKQYRRG